MLKKPAKNLELESLIQKTAADLALLFTRQDDRGIGPWHFHIDAIAGDWISDTLERYGLTRGDVDHRQLDVSDKQALEMERWKNDKERALEKQESESQTSVEALYKLRVGEGPGYHDPHCGREGEVGGSEPREECAGGDAEGGSERIVHRDPESKQLRLSFGDEATRLEFWGEMNSMQRKVEAAADKDINLDVVINRYIYDSMIKGKITSPDGRNSFEIDDELLQNIDLENMTPSQESVIRGMWIAGNILDLEMGHAGIRTSELHEKEIIALDQLREIRDLYDPKPLMQKEMATWDDDIQEVANDYMDSGADDFERWQIFNAIKGHHLGRPIVTQQYAQEYMEVGEWTQEVGGPGVRPEFLAVTMHDAQREGNLSEEVALQMVDTYTERANKYGTLENTYALYHNRRGGIKSYIFTHIDSMLPGQWIPPDEREEIRNTADLLNEGWSLSTQDLGGVAISEAVADVYGGESIPRENNRVVNGEQKLSAGIEQYMKLGPPDFQSYSPSELAQDFLDSDELETESREWVQTMYERTQEYFKYYGLNPGDTVRLYRGMNALANPSWNPNGDEGPAVVEMWSASSWSTDIETARRFANGSGSGDDMTAVDGAIVVSDMPIERILSTPQTGFGCKHETEFIVLGQDGIEATVYNESARSDDDIELMLDFWSGSRDRELAISDEAYQKLEEAYANKSSVVRGGPGSGHHGHEGRPGEVGGSVPDVIDASKPVLFTLGGKTHYGWLDTGIVCGADAHLRANKKASPLCNITDVEEVTCAACKKKIIKQFEKHPPSSQGVAEADAPYGSVPKFTKPQKEWIDEFLDAMDRAGDEEQIEKYGRVYGDPITIEDVMQDEKLRADLLWRLEVQAHDMAAGAGFDQSGSGALSSARAAKKAAKKIRDTVGKAQAAKSEIEIKFSDIDMAWGQTGLITSWIAGEQVGSLAFGIPSSSRYRDRYDVELGWTVVQEGHRRKGVATAMMDEFFKHYGDKKIAPYETTPEGRKFMKEYRKTRDVGEVLEIRGGPGSGHHGHAGRPGEVGGSQPSGASAPSQIDSGGRVAEAEAPYASEDEYRPTLDDFATWADTDALVWIDADNGDGTFNIEVISGVDRGASYDNILAEDLWESDRDEIHLWIDKGPDESIGRAVASFGLTEDLREAGYILPDGTMLNFSGSNEGGQAGMRSLDHRDIGRILLDDEPGGTEGMIYFMDQTGAIRMSWSNGDLSVDFSQTPTSDQKEALEYLVAQSEFLAWDYTIYDAVANDFRTVESRQMGDPTIDDLRQVFRDIKSADMRERSMLSRIFNMLSILVGRGGPGSGHYDHEGRPGEVGGSVPSSGQGVAEADAPYGDGYDSWGYFMKVPKTERWQPVRDAFDLIAQVHTIPRGVGIRSIPIKASKGKNRVGFYRYYQDRDTRRFSPKDLFVQLNDAWATSAKSTMVHELAHYLDQQGFYKGLFASEIAAMGLYTGDEVSEELFDAYKDWLDVATSSQHYQDLQDYSTGIKKIIVPENYYSGFEGQDDYYVPEETDYEARLDYNFNMKRNRLSAAEVFARSYVQWIGTKTGDTAILRDIERQAIFEDAGGMPRYWKSDDFQPISEAMDEIFRSGGWLKE